MAKNFWKSIGQGITDFWNGLTGQTQEDQRTAATNQANKESVESTNQANLDIAKDTNATNKAIADENLAYQRELQEYNRALQERIFEREDTSYERTAKDMINAGLNPLSMQGTNGAGEVIAQNPLNNPYQAQQPSPMQAYQAQKANVMATPLQAIQGMTSLLGTAISSIESIKTGSVNRDSLRTQSDSARINTFLSNIDKGVIYNAETGKLDLDEDTFNKYLEQKAKEKDYNIDKMENDIREWKHLVDSGKYGSDTKYEQMITALQDWFLNGRGEDAWNKLKEKYPILNMVDTYAKQFMESFNAPYDTEVTNSHGGKKYYKNGVEVDKNGNPINTK